MSGWSPKTKRRAVVMVLLLLAACAGIRQQTRRPDPFSLALPRVGGGTVRLSLYRGQVLLVDFFTTWSQASLLAIPGYTALHEKYRGEGLSFVGIAMDELGEAVVAPFVTGLEIPYPVALANDNVRRGNSPFGEINANPLLVVFDRKGKLRKIFVGRVPMREVEKVILELL
jgi:thiol-disulfide isomerase/thioredoxin